MSILAPSADALVPSRDATQRLSDVVIGLGVGIAAFLVIVGWKPLDVTNMVWLTTMSDAFTHYLGWEFFRRSPWTWPLGLNPTYGLQFSSSVIFSDSVPLVAIPLKLLSPLLPETFQYTGWWTLVCFVLQAYFASRLASLISRGIALRLGLAVLLVFSPPMLWRLSVHYPLVAHWTILAALLLYFSPPVVVRRRWLAWAVLFFVTVLIHTYLLAMCAPIWLASLARRRMDGPLSPPWFVEIPLVFATIAAALWMAGFFPLRPSFLGSGYGLLQLNLLSLINPNGSVPGWGTASPIMTQWGWSAFLPMLPQGPFEYEGFNYLGVGGLLAVALSLPLAWIDRKAYVGIGLWPLVVAAVLLTLFALSPRVTVADYEAIIPVPDAIYALAGSLRASGRLFWPVFYLIPLGAAWLLNRRLGGRAAGLLFVVLAGVQVYDTSPGWTALRIMFEPYGSRWTTSTSDPRLDAVATHYRAVRALPASNSELSWREISYFALRNHLPTDSTYLARPRDQDYAKYALNIDSVIAAHALEADSIYFLDTVFAKKIAASMSADDAMFRAGKFYVFAPGWRGFGLDADLPGVTNP